MIFIYFIYLYYLFIYLKSTMCFLKRYSQNYIILIQEERKFSGSNTEC